MQLFSFLSLLIVLSSYSNVLAFDIKQAAEVQTQAAQIQPKAAAVNIDAIYDS
jgi:hypothetical protein